MKKIALLLLVACQCISLAWGQEQQVLDRTRVLASGDSLEYLMQVDSQYFMKPLKRRRRLVEEAEDIMGLYKRELARTRDSLAMLRQESDWQRERDSLRLAQYHYLLTTSDAQMLSEGISPGILEGEIPQGVRERLLLTQQLRLLHDSVDEFERKAIALSKEQVEARKGKSRVIEETKPLLDRVNEAFDALDAILSRREGLALSQDQERYRQEVVDRYNQLLEKYLF